MSDLRQLQGHPLAALHFRAHGPSRIEVSISLNDMNKIKIEDAIGLTNYLNEVKA